jgi:hypothetical protein
MIPHKTIVAVGLLLLVAGPSHAKPNKAHTMAHPSGATFDPNKAAIVNGEKIRRDMDAQSKRWDAAMKKVTTSICRGC